MKDSKKYYIYALIIGVVAIIAVGFIKSNQCDICGRIGASHTVIGYKLCDSCYDELMNSEREEKKENKNTTPTLKKEIDQPGRERDAWICAQDIVKQSLKAPATAKFCKSYEATVTYISGSDYKVEGFVDAENGFGANIRTNFTVTLTLTKEGYKNGLATFDE